MRGDLGEGILMGGLDSDIFVLETGMGTDTVLDFADGIDLLGLSEGLTFGELTVTTNVNQTTIADGNGVLAILEGITTSGVITNTDFVVV